MRLCGADGTSEGWAREQVAARGVEGAFLDLEPGMRVIWCEGGSTTEATVRMVRVERLELDGERVLAGHLVHRVGSPASGKNEAWEVELRDVPDPVSLHVLVDHVR